MAVKYPEGFTPFVIVPEGYAKVNLEREPLLDYIEATVHLSDLESFVLYVNQFKNEGTKLFANLTDDGADFVALIDYHKTFGAPSRNVHRVEFSPAYSAEFKAWRGIDGQAQSQDKFLEFLRRWGNTVSSLTDADLIELASSLDFKMDGEFSSHVERIMGGRKLLFNERIEGSAQLKGKQIAVPENFEIELPIFAFGMPYAMGVDLLYRPQSGRLTISAELRRRHLVVRQAIQDLLQQVKSETSIIPFAGRA